MIDWLNIVERQLSSSSAISMTRASSIAYSNIVMREWMVQPGQQFVTITGQSTSNWRQTMYYVVAVTMYILFY